MSFICPVEIILNSYNIGSFGLSQTRCLDLKFDRGTLKYVALFLRGTERPRRINMSATYAEV